MVFSEEQHDHVELFITCRDFKSADGASPTDLMVVVSDSEVGELHRATVKESHSYIEFKEIVVCYYFGVVQKLTISMYNANVHSTDLTKQTLFGSFQLTLGELLLLTCVELPMKQENSTDHGTLYVTARETSFPVEQLCITASGNNLDSTGLFGPSDLFLEVHRLNADDSETFLCRTEVKAKTTKPRWDPISFPIDKLADLDEQRKLRISCLNSRENGKSHMIGQADVSVEQLLNGLQVGTKDVELINPKKQTKKNSGNSGTLRLSSVITSTLSTFSTYIRTGTKLKCYFALDFTASNGKSMFPCSLHHHTALNPSGYAMAIQAVGEVFQQYDREPLYPCYGFGAEIPPSNTLSHCFPLNLSEKDPNCPGIDGVLKAYNDIMHSITFRGPANFAPVINTVSSDIGKIHDRGTPYAILTIITDGRINDMEDTKAAIVKASALPMSIIIVGIGSANFDSMLELNGENGLLKSGDKTATEDIVQFVRFEECLVQGSNELSKRHLAQKMLAKIPNQLLSYMLRNKIMGVGRNILDRYDNRT